MKEKKELKEAVLRIMPVCLLAGLLLTAEAVLHGQDPGRKEEPAAAEEAEDENLQAIFELEYQDLTDQEEKLNARLEEKQKTALASDEEEQKMIEQIKDELKRIRVEKTVLKARIEELKAQGQEAP